MFTLKLRIANGEKLYQALLPESKDLQTHRASVDISFKDDTTIIDLKAKDFAAFRALEGAVMRLLVTYYKVTEVVKNE